MVPGLYAQSADNPSVWVPWAVSGGLVVVGIAGFWAGSRARGRASPRPDGMAVAPDDGRVRGKTGPGGSGAVPPAKPASQLDTGVHGSGTSGQGKRAGWTSSTVSRIRPSEWAGTGDNVDSMLWVDLPGIDFWFSGRWRLRFEISAAGPNLTVNRTYLLEFDAIDGTLPLIYSHIFKPSGYIDEIRLRPASNGYALELRISRGLALVLGYPNVHPIDVSIATTASPQ